MGRTFYWPYGHAFLWDAFRLRNGEWDSERVCCNAPHSVFHNNPLTSTDFLNRSKLVFENGNRVPIMIDDGIYAMAIIGIGCHETTTSLWIADPHIQEGVNLSADEKAPNGIYTIDLNRRGEQIRCSLMMRIAIRFPICIERIAIMAFILMKKNGWLYFPIILELVANCQFSLH